MPPSRGSSSMMSKGPQHSRLDGDDVQRSTMLMTRRRRRPKVHDACSDREWAQALKLDRASSHFITDEAWRRLFSSNSEELSQRWRGSRFACSSFSRISLFFFFFGCVRFGGFGLCFTVSVKFLFFLFIYFFLYLCLCLVAQKIWKRNGNLDFGWSFKKLT